MIKAIFLDIDGTLVSFRTHQISPTTLKAVHEVRQKGIKVFIATGRPRPFVDNLGSLEYDGVISVNGASITLTDGTVIAHTRIPEEDVQQMLTYQETHNTPIVYVSDDKAFATGINARFENVFSLLDIPMPPIMSPREALSMDVMQIIAFFDKEEEPYIMNQVLTNCTALRWHPDFIDCIAGGIDKATGIEAVCRHLGISPRETMAFGDGGNDIAMLKFAGWGIAMGNAPDNVKEVARYVTSSVDEDGVAQVLTHIEDWT